MRAIQVKCPNCAAVLEAGPDERQVRCSYCGKASTVQLRSGLLQVPVRIDGGAGGTPVARQLVDRPRVARAVALFVLLPLVVSAGLAVCVKRSVEGVMESRVISPPPSSSPTASAPAVDPSIAQWEWEGNERVILRDVDGDRVADPIGRLRFTRNGDLCHLAALRGRDGSLLWKSEPLGSYSDSYQGRVFVAPPLLLFADPRGTLRAFNIGDGKSAWSLPLADQVERACRGGDGHALLELADQSWVDVGLAGGAAAPGKPARACTPLVDDRHDPAVSEHLPSPPESSAGGKLLWKVEVPARDLLASHDVEALALLDTQVCAAYQHGEPSAPHLTCFALEDGTRAWDVAAARKTSLHMRTLVESGGLLYLSSVGSLQVFDAANGKPVRVIGMLF